MSDDLRAVAPGHAVSNMGYQVKVDRDGLTWTDGKHSLSWQVEKRKDGSLLVRKDSRSVKKHKHEAEGSLDLGARELAVIDTLVEKALKVLRIKGSLG